MPFCGKEYKNFGAVCQGNVGFFYRFVISGERNGIHAVNRPLIRRNIITKVYEKITLIINIGLAIALKGTKIH